MPIRRTKPQIPLFIPWCAGASRHERLLRKYVPYADKGYTLQRWSRQKNVARGLVPSHGQALRRPTKGRSLRRGRFQTGLGGGLGHQAVSPTMRVPPPSP